MSSENPYISVRGLSLKTPLGFVFDDATFAVDRGQVCALFGTEGSGKTSLILSLAGRMRTTGGAATVAGYDTMKQSRKLREISNLSIIERINEVPENLKVKDILASELTLNGLSGRKGKVAEALSDWAFEKMADVRYRDLSAYDKTYFGILLACVGGQEILFVDDVQSGLTQHQGIKLVKMFSRLAAERGITTLFCCSEYEIARYADCMVIISQEAAEQRAAVMRAAGLDSDIPVVGYANGVSDQMGGM